MQLPFELAFFSHLNRCDAGILLEKTAYIWNSRSDWQYWFAIRIKQKPTQNQLALIAFECFVQNTKEASNYGKYSQAHAPINTVTCLICPQIYLWMPCVCTYMNVFVYACDCAHTKSSIATTIFFLSVFHPALANNSNYNLLKEFSSCTLTAPVSFDRFFHKLWAFIVWPRFTQEWRRKKPKNLDLFHLSSFLFPFITYKAFDSSFPSSVVKIFSKKCSNRYIKSVLNEIHETLRQGRTNIPSHIG